MKRAHLEEWLSDAYTHCQFGSKDWCEGYLNNALDLIREQEAEIGRLKEALTPSAGTKAAYVGEFTISVERYVDDDNIPDEEDTDPYEHITVPWVTIKDIMETIRSRANKLDNPGNPPYSDPQKVAEEAAAKGKDPLAAYEAKRKELGLGIDLPD